MEPVRRVDVEGCTNFRDLGGYPTTDGGQVRWRLLFRADGLHELSDAGVAMLRDELALGDVVDLRSSGELAADGRGRLADEPIRFHHLPLFDGDTDRDRSSVADLSLGQMYMAMARFAAAPIARVLETLAGTDDPAVFHCAAGKDRTGVVSAVILSLLGVRDEIIVADYAASREALDAIVAKLKRSRGYEDIFEVLPPETLHADPETMEGFLAGMREEFGDLRAYARTIGLADASVERLRARLVER